MIMGHVSFPLDFIRVWKACFCCAQLCAFLEIDEFSTSACFFRIERSCEFHHVPTGEVEQERDREKKMKLHI
jgi:hypothetical protein